MKTGLWPNLFSYGFLLSFPVFVVLEGTVSGSSDYDRMEVKCSVA